MLQFKPLTDREDVLIFKNIFLYMMSSRLGFSITQNLNGMAGFFQKHFNGADNLRVVSIILLLLAFVMFLFLVVIIYIKSLLSFIKNDITPEVSENKEKQSVSLKNELELEKKKEQELEEELEKSRQRKFQEDRIRKENQARIREENARKLENSKKEIQNQAVYQKSKLLEEKQYINNAKKSGAKKQRDFDWGKDRVVELDEVTAGISSFKYEPTYKTLDSMTGLILNMFSRYIDSGKIAQTIKIRCGDNASEEDIIQLIDSMKNFISLCNNGKFANLPDANYLPSVDEALYGLAEGNSSLCLSLLENLMNYNIDKGQSMKLTQKRDIAFMEASNYACTFGTLASLTDTDLAISSLELAIELSPKNVNAWSRLADMYAVSSFDSKAIWAYQNIINIGDEDIYPHQLANAHIQLSKYYYTQGDMVKAKTLHDYGTNYYSSIGINQELTPKEQEIISIIESKQKEDLPDTINKLLNISRKRQSAY